MTPGRLGEDQVERLRCVSASALCDAEKTLRTPDAAVRWIAGPPETMAGRARVVIAEDDHLPVMQALTLCRPGEVLVVATNGHRRAVAGELFANEAHRRGLAGVVVDGYVRDMLGLRAVGIAVYARGTSPMSGGTITPAATDGSVLVGGVVIDDGDVVVGDEDGLVIGSEHQMLTALPLAMEIERTESAVLERMKAGEALHDLTNFFEHLSSVSSGTVSSLAFRAIGADAGPREAR